VTRSAQDVLEFDRLRELVRRETTCALGRREVERLAFSTDRQRLTAEFSLIAESIAYLRAGCDLGFGSLPDPELWLSKLEAPAVVLAAPELLEAAFLADTAESLRQDFHVSAAKFPLLSARAGSIADLRPLKREIRRSILPNGEFSDDASPELRRIRNSLTRSRDSIQKTLERILRERGLPPGEDYVTLRNDRFVIPVRAGERRAVQGVVHAASATGQTLFVEPLETVELNNKLVQLREDEHAEIARLLESLTEMLRDAVVPLRAASEAIADLDSIFARGRFARRLDCTLPEFSGGTTLSLRSVRHPILDDALRQRSRAAVPFDLDLGGEETVLVISGPNTGGKTVALKTIGLAALAAQTGIPVAAESASLPVFDDVLADIGDEQSISADLSTFSAHMLNLRGMLEAAGPHSLVLVDEMGTGTAPEEGAALAVALLDAFRARGCLTIATTHHDRLKSYAAATPGVVNASVEFDAVELRPTYRLRVGVPGGSSGIHIASRLGIPEQIVERARALLTPEAREAAEVIEYLHRTRDALEKAQLEAASQARELEAERKRLQTEWVERQKKRIAELERKFAETLKQHEQEIARAIEAVRERELRAQVEKQARGKLSDARAEARESADAAVVQHFSDAQADLGTGAALASVPVKTELLVPGVRVRVRGLPSAVVLRRRYDSSAEVEAGPLRMKVALDDITAIVAEAAPSNKKPARPSVALQKSPSGEPAADEINVIGDTVEEATRRADKFIDQAALAGKPRVRIIHGHGTGALRRGLAEFLSSHPLVGRISAETEDRGGTAITVVELKD